MAFTASELAFLVEITLESLSSVSAAGASLDAGTESLIRDDLDTWEAVRDSHLRITGGGDGIDLDNERKRMAIRIRVRHALGYADLLPASWLALQSDAMQIFEIEVGSAFG